MNDQQSVPDGKSKISDEKKEQELGKVEVW